MTPGRAAARAAAACGLCGMACALASPLVVNPGTYDITTETLLPHLEENLRYATTRHRLCLGTLDVAALFPVLRHETFAGCALADGRVAGNSLEYSLSCRNEEIATGAARLTVRPTEIRGVLEIKMGGKNMTLSQRITASRLEACEPAN